MFFQMGVNNSSGSPAFSCIDGLVETGGAGLGQGAAISAYAVTFRLRGTGKTVASYNGLRTLTQFTNSGDATSILTNDNGLLVQSPSRETGTEVITNSIGVLVETKPTWAVPLTRNKCVGYAVLV